MDFLEQVYFDNPIKSYLIVGGTILVMLILKRYFSRYIAALLYRIFNKVWKNVARQNFIDLVVEPLEWLLLIVIAVFAIDKLNFPTALQYKVYGHNIDDILTRLGIGIIVIAFVRFLLRIIDFIALVLQQNATLTADKADDQLVTFFRDFLKVIIGIIGLLILIKACFNQPIGNLLTSLSLVGAAVALAAKESLENLIASFIIFFDKPFTAGDTLKANNITGTVEKIGLRSTRIRTADKTLVTIPNKLMVDSVVDNLSMRTHRRGEIKLELATTTSSAALQKVIAAIKQKLESDTEHITSYTVHLVALNKNGNIIKAEYFTHPITMEDFVAVREGYYFFIKNLLEENKVELSNNNIFGATAQPEDGE